MEDPVKKPRLHTALVVVCAVVAIMACAASVIAVIVLLEP